MERGVEAMIDQIAEGVEEAMGDAYAEGRQDQLDQDREDFAASHPAPGQVERDREDAENYRWLCSHIIVPSPSLWDRGVAFTTPPMPRKAGQMTKAELDDFIRAARKGSPNLDSGSSLSRPPLHLWHKETANEQR